MHWTSVQPGATNWSDSRESRVTNWPGDWHVGTYASPDKGVHPLAIK